MVGCCVVLVDIALLCNILSQLFDSRLHSCNLLPISDELICLFVQSTVAEEGDELFVRLVHSGSVVRSLVFWTLRRRDFLAAI